MIKKIEDVVCHPTAHAPSAAHRTIDPQTPHTQYTASEFMAPTYDSGFSSSRTSLVFWISRSAS